jgi:hypothetical protein
MASTTRTPQLAANSGALLSPDDKLALETRIAAALSLEDSSDSDDDTGSAFSHLPAGTDGRGANTASSSPGRHQSRSNSFVFGAYSGLVEVDGVSTASVGGGGSVADGRRLSTFSANAATAAPPATTGRPLAAGAASSPSSSSSMRREPAPAAGVAAVQPSAGEDGPLTAGDLEIMPGAGAGAGAGAEAGAGPSPRAPGTPATTTTAAAPPAAASRPRRRLLGAGPTPRLVLPVLERTPEPLTSETWHLSLASLSNDALAVRHENATGGAAVLIVKGMAENNANAKNRIAHEWNTAGLLFKLLQGGAGDGGSAAAKAAPAGAGARATKAGAAAAAAGSPSSATRVLRKSALTPQAAKQVFLPLCPTAALELDATAAKADVAFETFLFRIARDEPHNVHKLLRRHIFFCCRLHKGDPWLPSTASRNAGVLGASSTAAAASSLVRSRIRGGDGGAIVAASSSSFLSASASASRARAGSIDLDGVLRGVRASSPRTTLETVREISRVVGSHSLGAKTAAFRELFALLYADVLAVAPEDAGKAGAAADEGPSDGDGDGDGASSAAGFGFGTGGPGDVVVPRNTLAAAIADLTAFTTLFTKGLLQKYPFLTSVPIARPVADDVPRTPFSSPTSSSSSFVAAPPAAAAPSLARTASFLLGGGGGGGGGGARKPSSSSSSAAAASVPLFPTDLTTATHRSAQEAIHVIAYSTLFRVVAAHTAPQDADAAPALAHIHPFPPCVYGLTHTFCAPDEPGCTRTLSRSRLRAVDEGPSTPAAAARDDDDDERREGGAGASQLRRSVSASAPVCSVGAAGTPLGHAAEAAEAYYRAAVECMAILTAQHSPLTKVGALRASLVAINHGALVEKGMAAVKEREEKERGEGGGTERGGGPEEEGGTTADLRGASSAVAGQRVRSPGSPLAGAAGGRAGGPLLSPASPVAVGADDLVPRLCFVLVRSRPRRVFAELAYLEECMPVDRSLGEDGYAVVSLRGAVMHVLYLARALGAGGKG